MKYVKELLALVLLCAIVYSCKDKVNDETVKEEGKTKDAVTASVTYSVSGGDDMLNLVDISIEYVGAEGKTVESKIESLPWTKEINGLKLPFKASSELKITKKNNPDLSAQKYNVGLNSDISWKKSDGSFEGSGQSGSMTIISEKADAYLNKLMQKDFTRTKQID